MLVARIIVLVNKSTTANKAYVLMLFGWGLSYISKFKITNAESFLINVIMKLQMCLFSAVLVLFRSEWSLQKHPLAPDATWNYFYSSHLSVIADIINYSALSFQIINVSNFFTFFLKTDSLLDTTEA